MNTKRSRSIFVSGTVASASLFVMPALASSGPDYHDSFQRSVGGAATFHVTGPATGESPDVEGDATLIRVEMPTGDQFISFYKPVAVHDAEYDGRLDKWLVRAGSRCTIGLSDIEHYVADGGRDDDDDDDDLTQEDLDVFEDMIFRAFNTNNLNNYVDNGDSNSEFYFTIEFDMTVNDNDPEPDEFGEILYFERGAGSGNSWLKMQAVDEEGEALGPWLLVGPDETVQTSPVTTVMRSDQKMGTTSIDVSRLGVSSFKYLRISNDVTDHPAYTGGGDRAPDFKIMVVMTNDEDIQKSILFD